jgi:hypothetical protein
MANIILEGIDSATGQKRKIASGDAINLPMVITIPDGSNVVPLVINQNDITNNPIALQINNPGTGFDIDGDTWSIDKEYGFGFWANHSSTGSYLSWAASTQAAGTIFITELLTDGDTIQINDQIYTFKDTLSVGPEVPNEVLIGVLYTDSIINLNAVFNDGGVGSGTLYATGTALSTGVIVSGSIIFSTTLGAAGNALPLVGTFTSIANTTNGPTLGNTVLGVTNGPTYAGLVIENASAESAVPMILISNSGTGGGISQTIAGGNDLLLNNSAGYPTIRFNDTSGTMNGSQLLFASTLIGSNFYQIFTDWNGDGGTQFMLERIGATGSDFRSEPNGDIGIGNVVNSGGVVPTIASAGFYYDYSTNRIGIGTIIPGAGKLAITLTNGLVDDNLILSALPTAAGGTHNYASIHFKNRGGADTLMIEVDPAFKNLEDYMIRANGYWDIHSTMTSGAINIGDIGLDNNGVVNKSSFRILPGSGNGITVNPFGLANQSFEVNGRIKATSLAATAANDLTLGYANLFIVAGATQINAITTTGWTAGSQIVILFSGAPLVKHNTAGGASTAPIFLAGSADFQAAANSVLTLIWDGTQWQEVSRKVA